MHFHAYIAVGSNLGDREDTIASAVRSIERLEDTTVVRTSTIIQTDPVGPGGQGAYLNGVLQIRTALTPRALLDELMGIERAHGRDRDREQRWGARTLDLDLLIYDDRIIDEPGLSVPHPRMHERSFVLIPLCEIAPDLEIPGRKETPRALLGALSHR